MKISRLRFAPYRDGMEILDLFVDPADAALYDGSVMRSYDDITEGSFTVVAIYDPVGNPLQAEEYDEEYADGFVAFEDAIRAHVYEYTGEARDIDPTLPCAEDDHGTDDDE